MSTSAELARAAAYLSDVAKVLSNGVWNVSAMFQKFFHTRRAANGTPFYNTNYQGLRGVEWNCGGQDGTNGDHRWPVRHQIPTATTNRGELGTRSFSQADPAQLAGLFYYSHEVTGAMSKRDLDLRKNDNTMIFDLEKERMLGCEAALFNLLRQYIWRSSETNGNGGLTLIGTVANVAAETNYAGISMKAANTHWTPPHYDYGAFTIAANLDTIINTNKVYLTRSADATGGVMLPPDFACFSPTSWGYALQFVNSKRTIQNNAGVLTRPDLGVHWGNFWWDGVDCFYDLFFGGSTTGYMDSTAAEEFIMGHSDKVTLRTTQSKGEGLFRVLSEDESAMVRGKVWVIESGMQMLKFESPAWFNAMYT